MAWHVPEAQVHTCATGHQQDGVRRVVVANLACHTHWHRLEDVCAGWLVRRALHRRNQVCSLWWRICLHMQPLSERARRKLGRASRAAPHDVVDDRAHKAGFCR